MLCQELKCEAKKNILRKKVLHSSRKSICVFPSLTLCVPLPDTQGNPGLSKDTFGSAAAIFRGLLALQRSLTTEVLTLMGLLLIITTAGTN